MSDSTMGKVADLHKYIVQAMAVGASEASEEVRYEVVFDIHARHVKPLLDALGLKLEWTHLDTSPGEDVQRYVDALEKMVEELIKVINAVDRIQ